MDTPSSSTDLSRTSWINHGRRIYGETRPQMHSQHGSTSDGAERSMSNDGGNIYRSLQIDMKSLVGDAVGNVSTILLILVRRPRR